MIMMKFVLVPVFVAAVAFCQAVGAVDLQAGYFSAVGDYFDIPVSRVAEVANAGIAVEELPVVFFVAGCTGETPMNVAKGRNSGSSWMELCEESSTPVTVFYVVISGSVNSRTYGPIFEKFNNTPKRKWNEIDLSDVEIVNLVNLRLLYSLHDYSVFEIMAMRDYGKSFPKINQQVLVAKKEMNEKNDAVLEAR